jgi:hypothetical protein
LRLKIATLVIGWLSGSVSRQAGRDCAIPRRCDRAAPISIDRDHVVPTSRQLARNGDTRATAKIEYMRFRQKQDDQFSKPLLANQ